MLYKIFDAFQTIRGFDSNKLRLIEDELRLKTINDFLEYFPYKYISRVKINKISDLNDKLLDNIIEISGTLKNLQIVEAKNKKTHLEAKLYDEDNNFIKLLWFNHSDEIQKNFKNDTSYTLHGELTKFKHEYYFVHPYKSKKQLDINKLLPYYVTTANMKKRGVDSKFFRKIYANILGNIEIEENLTDEIINKYKLISHSDALKYIHQPIDNEQIYAAKRRLKFEELFFLQLKIFYAQRLKEEFYEGYVFSNLDLVNDFKNILSQKFELTNAQKRVLNEIYIDLKSGKQMNRLLQGDVGSGKTIVAFLSMLMAVSNGYQTVLMCPTEILAEQHFMNFKNWCNDLNLDIELLIGSIKTKQRNDILGKISSGSLKIIIGTHALLNENINFNKLGLVIIDEQHKFGVEQRSKFLKNVNNATKPHVLIMTATPIPRTLAMVLYGNYNMSVINEMPRYRKPIKTMHFYESQRLHMFGFVQQQLKLGHQVYFVYPLIEYSGKVDLKNVIDGYDSISRYFKDVNVGIIHGQMDFKSKNYEFEKFQKGVTKILVATTVIEVGIDVPNATVIVIEEADRFGLSQMHQLRGRVGRGKDSSFCILMTKEKLSEVSKMRIKAMLENNDGFSLANIDLKIRGYGDMLGIEQSGNIKLKIADIVNDESILKCAIAEAKDIINKCPDNNNFLFNKMIEKNNEDFSNIG